MTQAKKRRLNPLTLVLILSGAFFSIFVVISALLFFRSPKPGGRPVAGAIFGSGSVGVIELNGVILDSKRILKQLEQFEEDDSVKSIVLRLNSPGGSVAPSQEIYEAVKRIDRERQKPVIASMQSVAASGAYYVAMGARKVYANPGTITGSIGVIMEFANLEKLYEWARIRRFTIKTGKFKDAGADFREMTEEERALLQGMINDVLAQFKQAVMESRKMSAAELDPLADGRIFSGQQAKAARLVDELGTFKDAVKEAAKLGKVKGKPSLVYPDRARRRILDLLLDDPSRDSGDSESEAGVGMLGWLARKFAGGARMVDGAALAPGVYWLWNGAR